MKRKILNIKPVLQNLLIFAALGFFLFPSGVFALTDKQRLNQLGNRIDETKQQLNETRTEKLTLQGEVAAFDKKIGQIESEITVTENEIKQIEKEIRKTEGEIVSTEAEIKETKIKLKEILRVSYEEDKVSIVERVFASNSFSDFLSRQEYINTMQLRVKEISDRILALKNRLENQKRSLEERKQKGTNLLSQQEAQKEQLAGEKRGKSYLLEQTRGEEARYRNLKNNLDAQYKALEHQIWVKALEEARSRARAEAAKKAPNRSAAPAATGGYVSFGTVRRGNVIGYQGNSGFSSGTHLHFEIRGPNQNHVNPASYIGNGYFGHPVAGARVTQGYGYTTWWAYSFHTGIDYSNGYGAPIRAVADGQIIARTTGQRNTYPGGPLSYGNYVLIRHTNGWYSLYAHLR